MSHPCFSFQHRLHLLFVQAIPAQMIVPTHMETSKFVGPAAPVPAKSVQHSAPPRMGVARTLVCAPTLDLSARNAFYISWIELLASLQGASSPMVNLFRHSSIPLEALEQHPSLLLSAMVMISVMRLLARLEMSATRDCLTICLNYANPYTRLERPYFAISIMECALVVATLTLTTFTLQSGRHTPVFSP